MLSVGLWSVLVIDVGRPSIGRDFDVVRVSCTRLSFDRFSSAMTGAFRFYF